MMLPTPQRLAAMLRLAFALSCLPAALICLPGGVAHAAPPPISFVEPSLLPTPATNDQYRTFAGVAKGDFNGDGKLDVAALLTDHNNSNNYGEIEITLGNGDGTFRTPTILQIPHVANGNEVDGVSILAKDFNGDGKLDLAITTNNGLILVFPGHGDGTFGAPITTALPSNGGNLQTADLNGDGKPDLVTVLGADASNVYHIAVLLGNGDGSFHTPVVYPVEASPSDLALANVDNKNGIDIVVGTYDGHSIDVLLNNGSGTFAPFRSSSVGAKQITGLYVADFDGDGKLDVVAGGNSQVSSSGNYHSFSFVFMKGVGDGTFLSPSTTNDFPVAGISPQRALSENVTPDLNGDGIPDVVFAIPLQNAITVGLGDGHGGFSLQTVAAAGATSVPGTTIDYSSANSFVFGQFTGHANPDIVVSGYDFSSGAGNLSLVRGNPAKPGAFLAPSIYSTGDQVYNTGNTQGTDYSFALGDFLHNGKISLATLTYEPNGVLVIPGLGDGTFTDLLPDFGNVSGIFSAASGPSNGGFLNGLNSADFNGDGLPDVIYNTVGGVQGSAAPLQVLSDGQGNGTFSGGVSVATGSGFAANTASEIARFNPNTPPGYAVDVNETEAGAGALSVIHLRVYDYGAGGNPNSFGLTQDINTGSSYDVHGFAAGDFDGDGKPDLIAHTVNPERLSFYKGNGDGTFQAPVQTSPGINYLFSSAVADLNGDGKLDLIFGTYNAIYVLLGNGDGTFQQVQTYPIPGGGESMTGLAVADFNGDGHLDVAVAGSNDAVVFPGNGDGTLGAPQSFATGYRGATVAVHAADLNGDGRPDLVYSVPFGQNNYNFAVLLNGTSGSSPTHLLWTNTNGAASLWTVNANGAFSYGPNYGPYPGWSAKSISDGPDGLTHLLWAKTDGTTAVWNVAPDGTFTQHGYGPFAGYTAKAISTSATGVSHLLWNNTNGAISLWNLDTAGGGYSYLNYGPYQGWTANAVADGPGTTDLLWNNTNGQMSGWKITGNGAIAHHEYGPYANWNAQSLSVGPDNEAHLLWDNVSGQIALWNVDFGTGGFTQGGYGPFSGWMAEAIATGQDNVTHILWNHTADGEASLWDVVGNGTPGSRRTNYEYGPYPGWTAIAVSAGPAGP